MKEKKEKKIEKEKKYLERLHQLKSFPSHTDRADNVSIVSTGREVYEYISRVDDQKYNFMVKLRSSTSNKSKSSDSPGSSFIHKLKSSSTTESTGKKIVTGQENRNQKRQVSFDICTDNDFSDEASSDEENGESGSYDLDSMSPLISIRSLPDDLVEHIELIFIDEKCVFSKFDPSIWKASGINFDLRDDSSQIDLEKALTAATATTSSRGSSKVVHSGLVCNLERRKTYLDIFLAQAIDLSQTTGEAAVTTAGGIGDDQRCHGIRLSQCLMHSMVPFLTVQEMIYFSISCKAFRSLCNKDAQFRIRRKEGFAMVSHDYSKAKKNEKKKKIKQANVKKMTKKDAFARGGNDGMH